MNSQQRTNNQQRLTTYFDERTQYDEKSTFHKPLAYLLVEAADLQPGQTVLDIATGTGLVAIEAAQRVGNEGRVIGVDLSAGMLAQARRKITALGLKNIEMIQADAEVWRGEEESCDRILCCSALPYFQNIPQSLHHWYKFLKPGGKFIISACAETAFIVGIVLHQVTAQHGIILTKWHEFTKTQQDSIQFLKSFGYNNVQVITAQLGDYLSLESAQNSWSMFLKNPLCLPLIEASDEIQQKIKQDYCLALEKLVTEKGIWNDITTYIMIGEKT